MLEHAQLEKPITSDALNAIQQGYTTRAQSSFWFFRCLIDPTIKHSWWQQVAAQYLQNFYNDMIKGKRPKIIIRCFALPMASAISCRASVLSPQPIVFTHFPGSRSL
jgi:hypothetical protein